MLFLRKRGISLRKRAQRCLLVLALVLYFYSKKSTMIIPAIIAGVGALAGGINSIISGNKAARAERQLQERRDQEKRRYLHEMNTDFLDTETAQSTLATLRKKNSKQVDAANTDAVKQGLSEEAQVAMAGKLNEGYADAASRLAGFGTQYKQQLTDSYLRRSDSLDNAIYNSQMNKAAATSSMTDAIGGVVNAGMSAWGSGAFSKSAQNAPDMKIDSTVPLDVNTAQADFLKRNQDIINYGRPNLSYR